MKYPEKPTAVLLLEDGSLYYGKAIGKIGVTTGEICFNTGMTGYQEIFTDPSYFGQILLTTTSHIGNYGVHQEEVESESLNIAGLVCKTFTHSHYSRASAEESIQQYFEKQGLIGISDVDTRAVVRHVRSKGAMNAIISSLPNGQAGGATKIAQLKKQLAKVPSMKGLELSSNVSAKAPYFSGKQDAAYKVAVLDLGVKKNILNCLAQRDCNLQVFPMHTSLEEIMAWEPDGIMLSNGPGDPSAMPDVVQTVKCILETNIPVFGICLGHQILGLACGLHTFKMHNGHRGVNHPVKNLKTGKCEITSQNHGFVVDIKAAEKDSNIEVTHVHLNDGTLAGFRLKDRMAFSVQYHPEASAGPHDSRYLFDTFVQNMKVSNQQRKFARSSGRLAAS